MSDDLDVKPKKKILWIEDDALLCTIITKEFAATEFGVVLARDGREALDLLKDMVPDMVIVDLILPGNIDGFAVLEKMHADLRLKDIPKMVLSNLSKPADIDRAKRFGITKFLVKADMSLGSILAEIRSHI